MRETFDFFGMLLPYRRHGPGTDGERTVEVPIAVEFLRRVPLDSVIEIGAVMPYHEERLAQLYLVADPFDPWPGCVRVDGEVADVVGRSVLCISTLEHMGRPEYGNEDVDETKGCRAFDRIAKFADKYLVTIPIGWNPVIDKRARWSGYPGFTMERITRENEWILKPEMEWDYEYSYPFPYANGVAFVTNMDFR